MIAQGLSSSRALSLLFFFCLVVASPGASRSADWPSPVPSRAGVVSTEEFPYEFEVQWRSVGHALFSPGVVDGTKDLTTLGLVFSIRESARQAERRKAGVAPTDDAFAKTVGLPGVIMHGMCTLALSVNAVVRDLLDGHMRRVRGVACRFSKMLLPGQAIRVRATRPDAATIHFEAAGPDGNLVIAEGVVRVDS